MKVKMTTAESCMLRTLHQIGEIKVSEIIQNKKKYPGFAKFPPATLYRHAKRPLDGSQDGPKQYTNRGRKRKLNAYDLRQIKRQIAVLREERGTFSSCELQESCDLHMISNSAFRRALHRLGYGYRRTRKKGLLSNADVRNRLRYVRKLKRLYKGQNEGTLKLWTEQINMYLDGVGFEFKANPYEHARTPKAREWRLKNEGLKKGCTTKGKKEGSTQVKFMVGIAHRKGVIMCEPIKRRMNGSYFSEMIRDKFPEPLGNDNRVKRILQDGDPSQNSKKAMGAFVCIGAVVFEIPARSPDLNPIENLFHLVRRNLQQEARNKKITEETIEGFTQRVYRNLQSFDSSIIDKIIETMPKRLDMIIKARGQRIKY